MAKTPTRSMSLRGDGSVIGGSQFSYEILLWNCNSLESSYSVSNSGMSSKHLSVAVIEPSGLARSHVVVELITYF